MTDYQELWPGGPLFNNGDAFPLGMDAVLLADFAAARLKSAVSVCELGCGSGAASLLLLEKSAELRALGIEIDPRAADAARGNLAANGWDGRAGVITGDLRDYKALLPRGGFDLALANPPYFAAGSGKTAPGVRGTARSEESAALADFCAAAAWCLKPGGSFCLVHRPERLTDILCALRGAGLEPKRARFVQHGADFAPSLALIEGRRGGKPGLIMEKPLLVRGPDGGDSEEFRRIYHM